MDRLGLTLLGGFKARLADGPAPALPLKAQALLAYLAVRPGQSHPRDKLAALLWGDAGAAQARDSLRHTVAALRKALDVAPGAVLIAEGQSFALDPEAMDVDVVAFERRVAEATPAALEAAVALYQGDLLEGLAVSEPRFEEWLLAERERLREFALEALAKLLAHQSQTAATERAIQTATRLLSLDPLQEVVHRTLMRLYARHGRRGAALKQYQICVSVLHRELRAEPEPETKRVYQEVLQQRSRDVEKTGAGSAPASARVNHPVEERPALPYVAELQAETMVGRDAEMGRLREALDEVARGHGRVVMVVGEAGIGKTSVLRALAAEAGQRGGRVVLGRSYESEQILPFAPWVDGFRTAQVTVDEEVLSTLAPVWRSELARLFPEVRAVGLPPPSSDQRQLFESVVRFVEHLAAAQPVTVLLEDLHWADEMTARLLSFLGRRIEASPVLVVVTAREEELADASALRGALDELRRKGHFTELRLAPLSAEDTATLVRSLSRMGSDPEAVARLGAGIWRVSEGNPFVVVEMLRGLGEESALPGSAVSLPLPERVRDVIARRLERLSDGGRTLAAVAAVIGREFEFALLARAAEVAEREAAEGLEELVRRRVLLGVGERFDFTHDRIREVVASQLLPARRKVLHGSVARALETLYADNLEPHYTALAVHYREAESWEKAVTYLRGAGAQAAARSALQDARVWFERALGAVEALPESQSTLEEAFEIRLELRPVLAQLGEPWQTLQHLHEAEALAEQLNDDRRRGRVCAIMTNVHSQLGELDEALVTGSRALEIARRLGDLRLRILTTTYLEQAHYHRGDYERVVELATANLAALPPEWVYEYFGLTGPPSVYDRFWLVKSLAALGRFTEAAPYEAEAIRLAEPTQHAFTVAVSHWAAGTVSLLKGDWAKARSSIEHWLAVVQTGNIVQHLPLAVASAAWILAELGERSAALDRLREGEQLVERQAVKGLAGRLGWSYCCLGRVCLVLGRLDEARSRGNRVLESCSSQLGFAADALRLLGDVAIHPDWFDDESGEAHYRKALALAEPRGMRPLVAHCHLGLGELYAKIGKPLEARAELSAAADLYRALEMTFWLPRAESALRSLS